MARSHRITFHLDQEVNALLIRGRARDRIPAARRLRAGLELWHGDAEFRIKVDQAALVLRRDRRGRRRADQTVKLDVCPEAEVHAALTRARGDDQLCAADRLRAVVQLWASDPHSRELIDARALNLLPVGTGSAARE